MINLRSHPLVPGPWFLVAAVVLLLTGCQRSAPPAPSPADESDQPQRLSTAALRVGDVPLVAEIAATPQEQQKGMMFREKIGPDEAMLFVFNREDNLAFWMKDTLVDLDLAFLGADGTILQIEPMTARNLEPVFSQQPARYALEVPRGWFAAHGIQVGAKVTMSPEAATPGGG